MSELPKDYIDSDINEDDKHLLELFYKECLSEGGTTDEITLRGIKAVISDYLRKIALNVDWEYDDPKFIVLNAADKIYPWTN